MAVNIKRKDFKQEQEREHAQQFSIFLLLIMMKCRISECLSVNRTYFRYASHNGMSTRVDNSMIENSETNVEASPEEAANKIAGFGVNDERYGESWFEGQNHPIGGKNICGKFINILNPILSFKITLAY